VGPSNILWGPNRARRHERAASALAHAVAAEPTRSGARSVRSMAAGAAGADYEFSVGEFRH
jgi:hypothetical protein